jgi:hypothetical protein
MLRLGQFVAVLAVLGLLIGMSVTATGRMTCGAGSAVHAASARVPGAGCPARAGTFLSAR